VDRRDGLGDLRRDAAPPDQLVLRAQEVVYQVAEECFGGELVEAEAVAHDGLGAGVLGQAGEDLVVIEGARHRTGVLDDRVEVGAF
jgi:hypothetical protein